MKFRISSILLRTSGYMEQFIFRTVCAGLASGPGRRILLGPYFMLSGLERLRATEEGDDLEQILGHQALPQSQRSATVFEQWLLVSFPSWMGGSSQTRLVLLRYVAGRLVAHERVDLISSFVGRGGLSRATIMFAAICKVDWSRGAITLCHTCGLGSVARKPFAAILLQQDPFPTRVNVVADFVSHLSEGVIPVCSTAEAVAYLVRHDIEVERIAQQSSAMVRVWSLRLKEAFLEVLGSDDLSSVVLDYVF